MFRQTPIQGLSIVALAAILLAGGLVHYDLPKYNEQSTDAYFTFLDGQRILAGENPYSRILSGNMRTNDKYSTYFPLFFLLGAGTQMLGLENYKDWISVWRIVLLLFNLGTGAVIFLALYRQRAYLLGVFGALFWFFNRWTLQITPVGAIDYVPIFFLVLSLVLLPRQQILALVLFSISLALKQMAIFLVPLYLIIVWQTHEQSRLRHVIVASALIASVTFVTSLPFLLWNAEGFVRSIVFEVTRDAASHINAPSLDGYFGLTGVPARLPMLLLLGLTYLLAWRRVVGMATGSVLVMVVFLSFNPVLFLQYFCWVVPLIPLAVAECSAASPLTPQGSTV